MKVQTYFNVDSWTKSDSVRFYNLELDKKQNTLAPRFRKETKRYVVEIEVPDFNFNLIGDEPSKASVISISRGGEL